MHILRRACSGSTSRFLLSHCALGPGVRGWPCRRISHQLVRSAASATAVKIHLASTSQVDSSILPGYLPLASPEQQVAIDTLLHTKNNLIVDAMAGSGKTTTILHLAKAAPETNFMVLVYNRRLMIETQQRAESLKLSNITILNYHTLGVRYYSPECSTDQGLKRAVENDLPVLPGKALPAFSVLVMDEQQDLTPILKRFIDKFIKDAGYGKDASQDKLGKHKLRIVALGDKRQEIYSFNNADSRFLTMASRPEIFGYVNDELWTEASQTYSNRITKQNATFINNQLMKLDPGKPMQAIRKDRQYGVPYPKPRYVIGNSVDSVMDEVNRLIQDIGMNPSDILILGPSTRGKSAALQVGNRLALNNIPVMRADSDRTDIPPEVANGKILICSYHQAKGIERPACIVLSFDQEYHTFYDKQLATPEMVSNPQYVAATRAVEHLVLIHNKEWEPLPFINFDTIGETCELVIKKPLTKHLKSIAANKATGSLFNVTGLCRNLSETVITLCLQRVDIKLVAEPFFPAPPPPTKVVDKFGLLEGIAHITGTAVPAIFQWMQTKRLTILDKLKLDRLLEPGGFMSELPVEYYRKLRVIRERMSAGDSIGLGDVLYVSQITAAKLDNDLTRLLAVPLSSYTWMSEAYAKEINFTLGSIPKPANITRKTMYEKSVRRAFKTIELGGGALNPVKSQGIILGGQYDMFRSWKDARVIWEIKHMDTLQPEHILQVVLYMLLAGEASQGYLVSARTGQTVQILAKGSTSFMEILQILVSAKSGGEQARLLNTYSDEEFLAEAKRGFTELVDKCALPLWFSKRPYRSRFGRRPRPLV